MEDFVATVTVREAADMLGVSVQHVHRLIEAGQLNIAYRLPGPTGAKLLHLACVEALLAERAP